ncbi:MAG: hypothetical protein IPK17_13890 [Chloroflexi bacterium]|nr:hypothetical protein [Chloroflexota bacterium]
MMIIATDAPLDAGQLTRLTNRSAVCRRRGKPRRSDPQCAARCRKIGWWSYCGNTGGCDLTLLSAPVVPHQKARDKSRRVFLPSPPG